MEINDAVCIVPYVQERLLSVAAQDPIESILATLDFVLTCHRVAWHEIMIIASSCICVYVECCP
jgi:hypothetical protein